MNITLRLTLPKKKDTALESKQTSCKSLDEEVFIEVFLEGSLPKYKGLRDATEDLLEEFADYSKEGFRGI